MKKILLLLLPILLFLAASPFHTAKEFIIKGTVTDETRETLIGAKVSIKGTKKMVSTDFDGNFELKSDTPCAILVFTYLGYDTIELAACHEVHHEIIMKEGVVLETVFVRSFRAPLIEQDNTTQGKVLTSEDIKLLPTRKMLKSTSAGASSDEGDDVSIRGSRSRIVSKSVRKTIGCFSGTTETAVVLKGTPPRSTPASKGTHREVRTTGFAIEGVSSDAVVIRRSCSNYYVDGILVQGSGINKAPYTYKDKSAKAEKKLKDIDELVSPKDHFSAGQLTAAEWSDLQNWKDWQNTANEDLFAMESIWKINPVTRYAVMVNNVTGMAIPNAKVDLLDKNGQILWTAKSDNTGRAELWLTANDDKQQSNQASKIRLAYEGETVELKQIIPIEKGINTIKIKAECPQFNATEILFVVDATGSMGDEIRYMQSELGDVINRVKALDFVGELRTGAIFYRDEREEYLLRTQDISPDTKATLDFIAKQKADGGGDTPEALEQALENAILKQKWSDDAVARIAFVLLDAPPHQTEEIKTKMRSLTKKAAEKGIKIVPVLASGSQSECEYLMRSIALLTNSRFLFLTDDSGIGNAHAEPSVGAYNVVFLNDLIFKLIVESSAYATCADLEFSENNQQVTGREDTFAVSCYPVPAREYVFVDIGKDVDKLEILDIQGHLLMTKSTITQGISTIYIDHLPAGTYVFKFTKGTEVQTVRLNKI